MGVRMIWPHDRSGLSLISPDLSQNKAARSKRATGRKETLTPEVFWVFFGSLLNRSELGCRNVEIRAGRQRRGQ